jgi:hypothetical protein
MWCLVRAIAHLGRGRCKLEWNNGETVMNTGKPKELVHYNYHTNLPRTEPVSQR